ncbi:MAG: NADP(H)-dependent aldo-keto reductase [Nevskiaceae bacterium]
MNRRPLGRTGLGVGVVGLGTMTWGEQNTEREAHEQLDFAVGEGVNFIDAAEMYPVPPKAETQGRTEQYLGSWLKARGRRDRLIVATKVTGPSDMPWLRGGPHPSREQIRAALESSLRRLQTDYVDLYQVHWPDRSTNFFGRLGYEHRDGEHAVPIEETLEALAQLVKEGKIRHVGVSNETPWGLAEYLRLARDQGWPRVASIQNPYNLLNRSFEVGLAEFAHREQVGLLAYSPLAFGVLSGKYLGGARPAGARLTLFSRFQRYAGERVERAVAAYAALARKHGLQPAQMALAYVFSRPFLASGLIGATTMAQLRENLAAATLALPPDVVAGIESIHRDHTHPAP